MRLLSFDVEKDIGWSWEKVLRCVADYTKRRHRNRVSGAGARDEFRLHVHCQRSRCERKFGAYLTAIENHPNDENNIDIIQQGSVEQTLLQSSPREIFRE